MSTSKNAILSAVAKATHSDKDDVRLHVDMFLAGVGAELAKSKAVNIKHFGILRIADDGAISFSPSPTLIRTMHPSALLGAVIQSVGADVSEELRSRFLPQAVPGTA
jgi:nucleoid DNA-binding protein